MTIVLVLSKALVFVYRSPPRQQGGPWADLTGTYPAPSEGQRVVPYMGASRDLASECEDRPFDMSRGCIHSVSNEHSALTLGPLKTSEARSVVP